MKKITNNPKCISDINKIRKFPFPISNGMKKNKGFIALISVLVIGAVTLSITISVANRSVSRTLADSSRSAYHTAVSLAELCAEYALLELERSMNYTGNDTITVGSESCDILTVGGSGNTNRTVETESTVSGHTGRVVVVVSEVSPDMTIGSWDYVADF